MLSNFKFLEFFFLDFEVNHEIHENLELYGVQTVNNLRFPKLIKKKKSLSAWISGFVSLKPTWLSTTLRRQRSLSAWIPGLSS